MIAYVFQKYPENFASQFTVPYLQFCSNLPAKFAIFLAYLLTVSIAFSVYKQNFTAYKN